MAEGMAFGDWVRRRRRALDLTQAELAHRLAYSPITIRRVEAGVRRPSKQLLEALATELGVTEGEREAFYSLGRNLVGAAPDPAPSAFGESISWTRRALPHPLTDMVGRREDEARVMDRLLAGARLVTLSGPGGVGKSRLATSVGRRAADHFDEVCWVELSGLGDPELVVGAVTDAMGVGVHQQVPVKATPHLAERRWLVVLDSLERLLECTGPLTTFLRSAPTVSLLVTTRTALRVPEEVEVVLSPLALPAAPGELGAGDEQAGSCAAVELFVAAARRVVPGFELTPDVEPAVVEVCRAVDGLPLGLEIAASNLRLLSVQDLAGRIGCGWWPQPQGGRHPRHRSLQATLDTSFALLTPAARRVLSGTSVFAGQWSEAAAEYVCADEEGGGASALSALAELRDHSMISVRTDQSPTQYAVLNTVRRYAREHLERTEDAEVFERRHVAYYAGLAEEACGLMGSAHQVRCLQLITDELDNFRAAMDHGVALARRRGDAQLARDTVSTAARLEPFWSTTGRSAEGADRIYEALALADRDPDGSVTARTEGLSALALLEANRGRFDAAWNAAEEMRAMADGAGDRSRACLALRNLGAIAVFSGDADTAEPILKACDRLARTIPDPGHVSASVQLLLGTCAWLRCDPETAGHYFDRAAPILRDLGDLNALAVVLRRQAQLSTMAGRPEDAFPLLQQSLSHNVELRSPVGIAACLALLADILQQGDDLDRAASVLGRAAAVLDVSGNSLAILDRRQFDGCRSALESRLGRQRSAEALQAGSAVPWEQRWPQRRV